MRQLYYKVKQGKLQSRALSCYHKVGQSQLQSRRTFLQSGADIKKYHTTPLWHLGEKRPMSTGSSNAVWEWSCIIWRNGLQVAQTFHYVKSACIRNYFGLCFTEFGLNSVRIQENMDQYNSEYGHFFTLCFRKTHIMNLHESIQY